MAKVLVTKLFIRKLRSLLRLVHLQMDAAVPGVYAATVALVPSDHGPLSPRVLIQRIRENAVLGPSPALKAGRKLRRAVIVRNVSVAVSIGSGWSASTSLIHVSGPGTSAGFPSLFVPSSSVGMESGSGLSAALDFHDFTLSNDRVWGSQRRIPSTNSSNPVLPPRFKCEHP